MESPVGTILLVTDAEERLCALDFGDCEPRMHRLLARYFGAAALVSRPAPNRVVRPLASYFAGDLPEAATIEVATAGSPFQRRVWAALRAIPPGRTTTYGAIAARLGQPGGSRAVGLANGANPVAIVIPCHRVIGADGALTGFGGGLHRKRWLLEHEAALASPVLPLMPPPDGPA